MKQRTLTIIKPDAVKQGAIGEIITQFEQAGFRIAGARLVHLTKSEAEGFYAVHHERPFFESLTTFMSSGPCMPMVLEGDDVITKLRGLMGATDPAKAEAGTIRNKLAKSIERNVVHGSDSPESAVTEIRYFFSDLEMV